MKDMTRLIKRVLKEVLMFLRIDITKNLKYDRLTRKILRRSLAYNSNCIDVGCHKGEVLEYMCKYSPNGTHYGFEPIPFLYDQLINQQKFSSVNIYPYALANVKEESSFYVVRNSMAYSGLKRRKYSVKNPEIEKIEVDVRRLDDILDENVKIDFIKIDVEGAEFDVLKGAEGTLKRYSPLVIFEFGLGASDFYANDPLQVYEYITEEIGLRLFTLDSYLSGVELTKLDFETHFRQNDEYYFVAASRSIN